MANLQIGPEPIRIGGHIPSIPSTSPIRLGIKKITGELESKSIILLHNSLRQEQTNLSTEALITYKNKLTNLDTNVAGIKDIKTKLRLFSEGINQIQNDLHEQYPNLSGTAFKIIQLEMANDLKQHRLKAIADSVIQSKKDLVTNLDLAPHIAATAKSDKEAKLVEGVTFKSIDDSVNNGIISLNEAKDLKFKFLYKEKLAQFDHLTAINPLATLSIPYEKSGLTVKDWIEEQRKASNILNDTEIGAAGRFKILKDQAKEQATPENAQSLYNKGLLDKNYTTYILGHKPDESDEALTNYYMGQLESITTLDEAHNIARQALAHGLTGTGKAIFNNRYHERLDELKTEHGELSQDLWNDIKSQLEDDDPTYYQPLMEGFSGNRKFNDQILRRARLGFKYSKDINEMHAIHDMLAKQINERYSTKKELETTIVPEESKESVSVVPPETKEPTSIEEFNKE